MTTTWTWRAARRFRPRQRQAGQVELRRLAALRDAAAAREGERHRRTMRSRVGAAIVAFGAVVDGGAGGVRGVSTDRARVAHEIGSGSRTA